MRNLNLSICIPIMLLLLHSYVMSEARCGDGDVIGAVGGAVTLNVGYTGVISITWNFLTKAIAIARTKPQGSPEIEHSEYDGRLNSTSDGSLIITKLRLEDQGAYKAQFRIEGQTTTCDYDITVFSNLTAEDVTINSNVTDNKTYGASLTCLVNPVNGRNVTIIWRSLNTSDVNQTQNVVFVPPSNINYTYICTANNPVSNFSKGVIPWVYFNNDTHDCFLTENERKNDISILKKILIGFAAVLGVVALIFIVWCFQKKKYRAILEYRAISRCCAILGCCFQKKMKEALTQEDKNDMNIEDQTGQEQKPEEGRKKSNVKSKQDSAGCLPATVYSQIQHLQAIELQESTSNETTGNTLYSTVQHVKQKNNTTKQPCPSNGKPSKAPPKPPHKVLEPPKGKIDQVESCYAEVQLPKDKSDQKSPSKGLNGDHSMAPMESCYAQVQLPKNCETQYGQVQGTGSKSSNE